MAALWARGGGRGESGAFLLGRRPTRGPIRIVAFVLYDDLDPHCLETGIIRFNGRCFGQLWTICEQMGLEVVADVHTHPGGCDQSASDQAHPMIARAGHIAMIVPRFARPGVRREEVGLYRYQGAQTWQTVEPQNRGHFFILSF